MLLVRMPRDLCTMGGGSSVKAHRDECSVLHPGNPFWNAVAWEGQGGSRAGWVGTAGSQAPGAAALCLPCTSQSFLPSAKLLRLLSLQGEGCCRPKWPCFPLPLHSLCPVGVQVTGCSDCFSDLDQNPLWMKWRRLVSSVAWAGLVFKMSSTGIWERCSVLPTGS